MHCVIRPNPEGQRGCTHLVTAIFTVRGCEFLHVFPRKQRFWQPPEHTDGETKASLFTGMIQARSAVRALLFGVCAAFGVHCFCGDEEQRVVRIRGGEHCNKVITRPRSHFTSPAFGFAFHGPNSACMRGAPACRARSPLVSPVRGGEGGVDISGHWQVQSLPGCTGAEYPPPPPSLSFYCTYPPPPLPLP